MAVRATQKGNHSGSVAYYGKEDPRVAVVCSGCHGAIRLALSSLATTKRVTCGTCGRSQPVALRLPRGNGHDATPFSEFPTNE